jgi:hypothetical protein
LFHVLRIFYADFGQGQGERAWAQGEVCPCCVTLPTLLDLCGLAEELELLLGVDVDLLTPGDLPPKFRAQVLAEAQPV